MNSLAIYAGPTALKRLNKEGFNAGQFKVLVGASGGPKWFVLLGLDRYLFGEFFADRKKDLLTVGSSVGAWRMCCLATKDPVRSIECLAHNYCHENYSKYPSIEEVTASAKAMLEKVLVDNGKGEIANNSIFQTHVVAVRARGFGSSKSRILQALHLGLSAVSNLFSRRTLGLFFERAIFTNMGDLSPWKNLNDISTKIFDLSAGNISDVMLSSGSIPFSLEGVRNISGANMGLYWDGGIVDYHFDWPFSKTDGLVLYPHFSSQIIPGWFDKRLPWRKTSERFLDNVVLLAPTKEFISTLPGGKIPDRNDFVNYTYEERVRIWKEVISKSESLAAELKDLVNTGENLHLVRPISERDR